MTTLFAINGEAAFEKWVEFTKTVLLITFILLYMNKKHWIIALIAVFTISIGYTGFKGGLYTLLHGGSARIWGPPGTGWGDNNHVSIAMLMAMPLVFAARHLFTHKLLRFSAISGGITFFFTLLGTQSRGGLVGLLGLLSLTIWRSKQKVLMILIAVTSLGVAFTFMPDAWKERMQTIQNYEQDASASNRIIQWQYAVQIANERPLFANGFQARYHQPYYQKYLLGVDKNRSVHSVYFQVLEEQGYIGLIMFLSLMVAMIISSHSVAKKVSQYDDLKWLSALLHSCQFSVMGFAANGLTINVAYLDLYYFLLTFIVILISISKLELQKRQELIT